MKCTLLLAFTFVCNSALAYNCVDYANRAIEQQNAAGSLSCGYNGPRWATNWQGHFTYCSIVGVGIAGGEDMARQQGLDSCLETPVSINNCNFYAFRAVKQNKANLALGCGYSGLRWQSNAAAHKAFCQITNFVTADLEDQARVSSLVQCVGK